eukprot:3614256-Prymnesium_polylepis.1
MSPSSLEAARLTVHVRIGLAIAHAEVQRVNLSTSESPSLTRHNISSALIEGWQENVCCVCHSGRESLGKVRLRKRTARRYLDVHQVLRVGIANRADSVRRRVAARRAYAHVLP